MNSVALFKDMNSGEHLPVWFKGTSQQLAFDALQRQLKNAPCILKKKDWQLLNIEPAHPLDPEPNQ